MVLGHLTKATTDSLEHGSEQSIFQLNSKVVEVAGGSIKSSKALLEWDHKLMVNHSHSALLDGPPARIGCEPTVPIKPALAGPLIEPIGREAACCLVGVFPAVSSASAISAS